MLHISAQKREKYIIPLLRQLTYRFSYRWSRRYHFHFNLQDFELCISPTPFNQLYSLLNPTQWNHEIL